jgi:NADP-dependent 3-hydroxy acid dehydrogenase YdfG
MLRPADVAEAIVFVLTRPPRVQVESLRLGPA